MSDVIAINESPRLLRLADGCRMLAEARTIEEVKAIRDVAQMMIYAVRELKLSTQAQNDAAEIKVRAERRIGGMLAEMPKHNGDPRSHDATRLSDLGIDKHESSRCQQIATVPDAAFEAHISKERQARKEITTSGILKLARALSQPGKVAGNVPSGNGCTVADLSALASSGKRFGCVYADPPWRYGNQATRASTDNHYQTMSVEDISALPIRDLAAEHSHCHLWTTNAFLRDAFGVLEAWGYEYKSCFVWVKTQMGIGNYWRVSHEFVLLGVRGNLPFADKGLMSWLEAERGKHSSKPERVRHFIERASPGPYLELFGRAAVRGWAVWGNEVSRDLFTRDLPEGESA